MWTCSDCQTRRDSAFFASIHAHSYGHAMVRDDDTSVFVTANDTAVYA